jgi:hypothetical protein
MKIYDMKYYEFFYDIPQTSVIKYYFDAYSVGVSCTTEGQIC